MSILRVLPLLPATAAINLETQVKTPHYLHSKPACDDTEQTLAAYHAAMNNPEKTANDALERLHELCAVNALNPTNQTTMSKEMFDAYGSYQRTFCPALLFELCQDPFIQEAILRRISPDTEMGYERAFLANDFSQDSVTDAFEVNLSFLKEKVFRMKMNFQDKENWALDTPDLVNGLPRFQEFHLCNGLHGIWQVDNQFGLETQRPIAFEQLLRVIYQAQSGEYRAGPHTANANMVKLPILDFLPALCLFVINICDQHLLLRMNRDAALMTTTNLPICLIYDNLKKNGLCLKVASSYHRLVEIVEKNKSIKGPSQEIVEVVRSQLREWYGMIYLDDYEFNQEYKPTHPVEGLVGMSPRGTLVMKLGMPELLKLRSAIKDVLKKMKIQCIDDTQSSELYTNFATEAKKNQLIAAYLEKMGHVSQVVFEGGPNAAFPGKSTQEDSTDDTYAFVTMVTLIRRETGLNNFSVQGGSCIEYEAASLTRAQIVTGLERHIELAVEKEQDEVHEALLRARSQICDKCSDDAEYKKCELLKVVELPNKAGTGALDKIYEPSDAAKYGAQRKKILRDDVTNSSCFDQVVGTYNVQFNQFHNLFEVNRDGLVCRPGEKVAPIQDNLLRTLL